MNEGEIVTIEIRIRVPKDCTQDQFEEWVEFNVGFNGVLKCDNPLVDESFEADDILF